MNFQILKWLHVWVNIDCSICLILARRNLEYNADLLVKFYIVHHHCSLGFCFILTIERIEESMFADARLADNIDL